MKIILINKEYNIIYNLVAGLLLFCIILTPLLIQNYVITTNPLFPLYNGIFKSEWFRKENLIDLRWKHPLDWKTIYDITFNGNKYIENMDYAFGFSYFIFFPFIPIIFLRKDKQKDILIIFFIFITSILLWFHITGPYMRYFISSLATGSIIIGLITSKILEIITNKIVYYSTILIYIVTLLLNMYSQTNIINITTPYPLIECLTHNFEHSNLAYSEEAKKVFDFAYIKYGRQAKCLLINSQYMYLANFEIESLSWYYYKIQQDIVSSSNNARELYDKIFIKNKFTFIIMPDNCSTPFNPDIFNDFNKMLVNEFTAGGYVLYSPQKNTSTTFDFCRYFQEANIYGNESIGAPWGKSITPLTINELNNKSAIFCAPSPVSKLEYNILINNNSILNTSIGFHPASKNFNVSDGVRMKIEVNDGKTDYVILNQYVMPEDNFIEKKMPLYQFTGKEIKIKFITSNDNGKNANGDWPIWLEPQIISNNLVD